MSKIVFTNGCFDIIHPGHIYLLEKARSYGDKLIVGINSDKSVRSIKGNNRPINSEKDRAAVLKGLKAVDEVRIFEELTPEKIINEIKPDVLVKGGDWQENEIIGADFVKENGGKVYSIPLKDGYSSTEIIEKISHQNNPKSSTNSNSGSNEIIINTLRTHVELFENIIENGIENIKECADLILEAVKNNNKILVCGNGGSAADAQHIATEFVGRYETERRALPAIALTTDTSLLTAVSNDYTFERIFERQIEALANKGDILIAISTSGNSPNVI